VEALFSFEIKPLMPEEETKMELFLVF